MKRIAVVTGASRGLGKAIALHLSISRYHVVALARDEKKLATLCDEIHCNGGTAEYICADLSNADIVNKSIATVITKHQKIDLLVNNAAILKRGTSEIADADIEELLQTNLNGAIYVAKCVANEMKKHKSGYIINISSLGGKVAAPFAGVYAASKFGLNGYSEALGKEMACYGVKVTAICPSMIATDMSEGRSFDTAKMIALDDLTKTIDYLLSLSMNAIPTEISISCLSFIADQASALQAYYLKKQ